ncbi:hypothetical protein AWENTII_010284 [Aspergillus wentii]
MPSETPWRCTSASPSSVSHSINQSLSAAEESGIFRTLDLRELRTWIQLRLSAEVRVSERPDEDDNVMIHDRKV